MKNIIPCGECEESPAEWQLVTRWQGLVDLCDICKDEAFDRDPFDMDIFEHARLIEATCQECKKEDWDRVLETYSRIGFFLCKGCTNDMVDEDYLNQKVYRIHPVKCDDTEKFINVEYGKIFS